MKYILFTSPKITNYKSCFSFNFKIIILEKITGKAEEFNLEPYCAEWCNDHTGYAIILNISKNMGNINNTFSNCNGIQKLESMNQYCRYKIKLDEE